MSGPLHLRPLSTIAAGVAAGGPTAADTVRASFEAIERRSALNAFLATNRAVALGSAGDVTGGALAGVPVAVKDNICVAGLATTCGSRILEGWVPPYEATAIRRLRAAGAVVVGKTNMDEFAMGSSTENSAYGPTLHPRDAERVPGGSSGGSAAAVAGELVPAALGTETGGSVRQPAALCGIVGIKPGYGRVSRYGLVAFASSLDQIGAFGRSVEDAALLLQVMAGADPLDSTADDAPVPDLAAAARDARVEGTVIGVPAEYFPDWLPAGIVARCRAALAALEAAGAELRDVSLPHTRYAIPTYYVIAPAEASANLARFDGVRFGRRAPAAASTRAVYEATRSRGFGAEVKRRILVGTFALSAGYHDEYYGRAQRVRSLIVRDFERVFASGVDLLFTPTTPTTAFRLGEKTNDPRAMYASDIFTVTASLAALPAISVPIGEVDGLPVGGQIIARRRDEAGMVRAAAALERLLA